MYIILLVTIFLLGTTIGSFLNVLILRMHTGQDILLGRSVCPECRVQLRVYELIPVISFLCQRGRCRHCSTRISWQYPLVEISTGVLFFVAYVLFRPDMVFVLFAWYIVCILTVVFVYDLRYQLILDRITLPAIALALVFHALHSPMDISLSVIGAIVGGGFFLLQYLLSQGKWIGGGDIRLGVLMGALLGWQLLIVALLIAYVVGAIGSLLFVAAKLQKRTDVIPFGTYLSLATVVVFLWGEQLLDWYIGLL